eukprot:14928491-Ditylum_brightwellii.AAC.1
MEELGSGCYRPFILPCVQDMEKLMKAAMDKLGLMKASMEELGAGCYRPFILTCVQFMEVDMTMMMNHLEVGPYRPIVLPP